MSIQKKRKIFWLIQGNEISLFYTSLATQLCLEYKINFKPWFYRVYQSKCEENQSRGLQVMLHRTSEQTDKQRLLLNILICLMGIGNLILNINAYF